MPAFSFQNAGYTGLLGGGSPYPTAGLLQWLDTRQGAGNFSPDQRTWYDLSGNGNHALCPTGWNPPPLTTNPDNGLPALRPDLVATGGYKTTFEASLPASAFIVQVVKVLSYGYPLGVLYDAATQDNFYGLYLDVGIIKLARGGSYGNYSPTADTTTRVLGWRGADNGLTYGFTNYISFGAGFSQATVNGLTYGNVASGGSPPAAYQHLFLVYATEPALAERQQLLAALQANFNLV